MFNLDHHLAASKRTIADMEHHTGHMRHAIQFRPSFVSEEDVYSRNVCWKVGALIRRRCPVTPSSATGKNIWR